MVTKYLIYLMSIHAKTGFQIALIARNLIRRPINIDLKTILRRKKDRLMSRSTKISNWLCPSMSLVGVLLRIVYNCTRAFSCTFNTQRANNTASRFVNGSKNQIPAFAKLENCSDDEWKGSKCSYTCGTGYENTCGNKKRRKDFDSRSLSKSIIARCVIPRDTACHVKKFR